MKDHRKENGSEKVLNMKILLIRHGDPDYKNDTLTEKGWKEAECLAEMLSEREIDYFYTSPYGRAKDTASLTLERMGRKAETLQWLREFDTRIFRPDSPDTPHIAWDWLPQDWTEEPRFYDKDHWHENEHLEKFSIGREYREITEQFDDLLARHGYVREGGYYRAENPNHDTIALFCHFGLGCILLSHLWNVSPMVVWHNLCAAPSSVTTLATEERRKGIAIFRMLAYGETAHLYAKGEKPSFAARFCECYDDDTRHD